MKSNPRDYSTLIKSTTETAFQRAIILNKTSIIDNEIVEWLDIELPIDKDRKNARGHCVDLIGRSAKGYVICELKFGNDSNSDSPNDAAEEITRYSVEIKNNYAELDNCGIHHTNGAPFLWEDIAKNAIDSVTIKNKVDNKETEFTNLSGWDWTNDEEKNRLIKYIEDTYLTD